MNLRSRTMVILLIMIVIVFSMFAVGCEPYKGVVFTNNTSFPIQVDAIPISLDYEGKTSLLWSSSVLAIEVGQSQEFLVPIYKGRKAGTLKKYVIIAIDEENEVVFNRIYTWDELNDMNWTVVITPMEGLSEINDNVSVSDNITDK